MFPRQNRPFFGPKSTALQQFISPQCGLVHDLCSGTCAHDQIRLCGSAKRSLNKSERVGLRLTVDVRIPPWNFDLRCKPC